MSHVGCEWERSECKSNKPDTTILRAFSYWLVWYSRTPFLYINLGLSKCLVHVMVFQLLLFQQHLSTDIYFLLMSTHSNVYALFGYWMSNFFSLQKMNTFDKLYCIVYSTALILNICTVILFFLCFVVEWIFLHQD